MQIACLHTADSNISVFDAAGRELGLPVGTLRHTVRADLLAAVEQAGGLTQALVDATCEALQALQHESDVVLLTCSTLGPAVGPLAEADTVPMLRVDRALAEVAAEVGGTLVVLCTAQTTLESTTRLFADAALRSGARLDVRLIPHAWALFQAGEQQAYLADIAKAADQAYADGATVVALAQASMAGAASLTTLGPRPLCSPRAGLAAAAVRAAQHAVVAGTTSPRPV